MISRGHIQKFRPIREDLDPAVSPQKIIPIRGQSRKTLPNNFTPFKSIKTFENMTKKNCQSRFQIKIKNSTKLIFF
jgi:hypothetical protein